MMYRNGIFDPHANLPFYRRGICMADGDGEGDDGGGGGGSGDDGTGDASAGNAAGDGAAPSGDKGHGLMRNADLGTGDADGTGDGDKPPAGDDADGKRGDTAARTIEYKGEKLDVPETFWNAETGEVNVGALLKSFTDTKAEHDRMKNEKPGERPDSPEGFLHEDLFDGDNLKLPDEGADRVREIPKDDPVLIGFAKIADKYGFTTAQFNGAVTEFIQLANGHLPEPLDLEAEAAALGTHSKDIIAANRVYLDGLREGGHLTDAEYSLMMDFSATATGQRAFKVMREQAGGKPIPILNGEDGGALPSLDELYASKPDPRTHPAEYEKWQETLALVTGTGNTMGGTSRPGVGVRQSSGAVTRSG